MLPRFLRNLPCCSLRHCKCLFASVLVVCAVTGLVSYQLRPNSGAPAAAKPSEGSRKLSSALIKGPSSDEDASKANQSTENVQFLPPTDPPPGVNEVKDEEVLLGPEKKKLEEEALQRAATSGPIFYGQSVKDDGKIIPNYDLIPGAPPRGDLPLADSEVPHQGIVRPIGQQLPSNIYMAQQQNDRKASAAKEPPPFVPERRLIHFDLKGAPPKIDYLQQLIPIIAKLGGTGLLIEYEDMFPYEGVLAPIAASNHYTKAEIKSLLQVAKAYELEVIPLVQTFGHLEYVLKVDNFARLRENPRVPQALCPSQNDSMLLVHTLIDQIMSLHEGVQFLHVGCDEVFHIAECNLCSSKNKDELFLEHVSRVATYVRNKYKIVPIIWDDMLRHMGASVIEEWLAKLVEPMVWVYAEDVYRFAGSYVFDRYAEAFQYFWISSSFKGAFGETLVVPDVGRHLDNNLNWLQVGRAESVKFGRNGQPGGLRGLAITGWQRYDHFSNLCELLPAGIPSMAVNLLTTSVGFYNQSLAKTLYEALSCQKASRYDRIPDLRTSRADRFLHDKMSMCFFPGAPFFKNTARFLRIEKEIEEYAVLVRKRKGWMTDYSTRHNYSSPARVDELLRDMPYLASSLSAVARQTMESLRPIYDAHTVSEWMEQKILPLFQKLDQIQEDATNLKAQRTWPVRPLELYDRWDHYGVQFDDYFNITRN